MASAEPATISQVRYGAFELKTQCPHCGRPLIINGPARAPTCDSCLNQVELDGHLWESLIGGLEEDHSLLAEGQGGGCTTLTGGFDLDISYWRLQPRCFQCKEKLDANSVSTGTDGAIPCPACGHETDTFPAPGWLAEAVPTARQIFGGEREGQTRGEDPGTGQRAVMVTCNNCGGSTRITRESRRTVSCSYCNAEMVLPEMVWRRFHTPRVVREWFVRFEGETPEMRQREFQRLQAMEIKRQDLEVRRESQRKVRGLLVPVYVAGILALLFWALWAIHVIGAWRSGAPDPWLTWQFVGMMAAAVTTNVLSILLQKANDEDNAFGDLGWAPMFLIPVVGFGFYAWFLYTIFQQTRSDEDISLPVLYTPFVAMAPFVLTSTFLVWFLRSLHFFF